MGMKQLIRKYKGRVVKYKYLPKHFQKSLALYLSIDGDLWDFPYETWKKHSIWDKECPTDNDREKYDSYLLRVMSRNINSHYIKKYGNVKFGTVEIPTEVIAQEIVNQGYPNPNIKTVEQYKEWMRKYLCIPNHPKKNCWPVILSDYTDDVLQDGWSRFSNYMTRGDKIIPCVYFP